MTVNTLASLIEHIAENGNFHLCEDQSPSDFERWARKHLSRYDWQSRHSTFTTKIDIFTRIAKWPRYK